MNRIAISLLSLVLFLSVFVFYGCTTVPEKPTTSAIKLTETYVFTGFGFSIDYPAGWVANTRMPVTAISELKEDNQRAFGGSFPVKGYLVVLDHRRKAFMRSQFGLPENPTLDDLLKLNTRFSGLQQPMEVSETVVFGASALSVRAHDRHDNWGIVLMGFKDNEAFLLAISTPSEEALDEIIPTWNKMLGSIKPVEE